MAEHAAEHAAADHGAHHGAEHKHGEMDIAEHERTFQGFISFWVYVFGASIAILIFLAIFNT